MNRNLNILRMATAAMLCAVAIVVPIFMPKLPIGPFGSVTLASHVPVFLAMFLSPATAAAVSLGAALGFQLAGVFPFPVVLRALTHVVWAVLGALWLKKHPDTLYRPASSAVFCGVVAVVHAACETLVVLPLFLTGAIKDSGGVFFTVVVMVGVVTLLHSTVDYVLSLLVWTPLRKVKSISDMSSVK